MITSTINDRIFSGGLDLQFLMTSSTQERHSFLLEFIRLLGRLIVFPVPTIALINGFALAGGCMLSFCHDYRFMRKDLGNMAMTEIELGMPLPPGMNAVV